MKQFRLVGKEFYTGNIITSKWYAYDLVKVRLYRKWLSEIAYDVKMEVKENA